MDGVIRAYGGFSVTDLEEARAFYRDVLGFEEMENPTGELVMVLPGGGIIFIYEKADHQPAAYTTFNLQVEDLEAAVAELARHGVRLEQYGMPGQGDDGIVRPDRGDEAQAGWPMIGWFLDPSGNIISIFQM